MSYPTIQETRTKFFEVINRNLPSSAEKIDPCSAEASLAWNEILTRYKTMVRGTFVCEEERHYHSFSHVLDCLAMMEKELSKYDPEDMDTLFLAIIYHDIVYNTSLEAQDKNEIRSAAFALEQLSGFGLNYYYFIQYVVDAILATDHTKSLDELYSTPEHGPWRGFRDYDPSVLIRDVDLASGLSLDWPQFKRKQELIAREYSNYPEDEFLRGQRDFFRRMLDRNKIFETHAFKKYEEQTRDNISRALSSALLEIGSRKISK